MAGIKVKTTVRVKDRDRGYRALMRKMKRLDHGPAIEVGILGDEADGRYLGGATVAQIASYHEFGLGVRKRSWLRDFVDENDHKIRAMISKMSSAQIRVPRLDERGAMVILGEKVVAMIRNRIRAGIQPDLDEETKIQKKAAGGKAKDTPLIFTGQFIGSISSRVRGV